MPEVLDQFWECPTCGAQVSTGPPVKLHPPKCSWAHRAAEMEQVTAPRFGGGSDR